MTAQFTHLIVLFESEAVCQTRMEAAGFSAETARQIAMYLAQATDLVAHYDAIRTTFSQDGIDVHFCELDDFDSYLPLLQQQPESCLLWNQTDGIKYYRGSYATSLARLLGVKTFGSPPTVQHFCQDKAATSHILTNAGIVMPPVVKLHNGDSYGSLTADSFFVRPNTLGAKLGIWPESHCQTWDEALFLSQRIWHTYRDEAVVSPYIDGYDVRVSYLNAAADGSDHFSIAVIDYPDAAPFMTEGDSMRTFTEVGAQAPPVPRELAAGEPRWQIELAVKQLMTRIGLRDVFSADFRVSHEHNYGFLLEFEVCPAVTIYDFTAYLENQLDVNLAEGLHRAMKWAFERPSEL